MDRFVHLHNHSDNSLLDGAARVNEMVDEAVQLNMPALAITDHGTMSGAFAFFKAARAAGITPVVGAEMYVAPASRFDKKRVTWGHPDQKRDDVSGNGAYTHATMWARNAEGLHNLFRLSTLASAEGFYQKARVDADLLAQHSTGIMATTGCPSGEVQTRLRLGQPGEALDAAAKYQAILGEEHYFLELMDHGLDIERRVRDGLLDIGERLRIPPVVTNDCHYTFAGQRDAHDALLCVQTGSKLADPDRFRLDGAGYHLKSAAEMYAIDGSDVWREGCANTSRIVGMVDTMGMFEHRDLMPRYPVAVGDTEAALLGRMVADGLSRRYPAGVPDDRRVRAGYELSVINGKNYGGYFLVVANLMSWARGRGIRCGVRGSAVGSLVGYALGICDIDPMVHGLLFERLLNPERPSMPDIDMDFDERRRGEVIDYAVNRYGADRVAQIATFGRIKAKAAIKDACRVLDLPYTLGDKMSKAYPPDAQGASVPLAAVSDAKHDRFKEAAAFREVCASDPWAARVLEVATGMEGLIRQTGVHPAGVVVSSRPLIDHVPLTAPEGAPLLTQFDFAECDELGLVKMDLLGLATYTVIDDTIRGVKANRGVDVDLDAVPLDDPATFALLAAGDTKGVFQLAEAGISSLLRAIQPTEFAHIPAVLALYRPGPMHAKSHTEYADRKAGRKPVVPIHPELAEPLAEVLDSTYGLIVYQEQVMAIAVKLAGYSVGRADLLRKAMGKKVKAVLDKEFVPFRDGIRERGYSDDAVTTLWDVMIPFASYGFNQAHAVSYGFVAYWTAYLKANYPAEFLAALLTDAADDKTKTAGLLAEARRRGIRVLPPDVNTSAHAYTPVGEDIRFGLGAIRGIGANVVCSIVAARDSQGKFATFNDFLAKVDAVVCRKGTVEALIKAGAMDEFGHTRFDLIANHAQAVHAATDTKKHEAADQYGLFSDLGGETGGVFDIALDLTGQEWPLRVKLAFERDMLGLYVSGHPLDGLEHLLRANRRQTVADISGDDTPDRTCAHLSGLITSVTRKTTKKGAMMAVVELEDLTGTVEVLFFPKSFKALGERLRADEVASVTGRVSHRDGAANVYGEDVAILNVPTAPVVLRMMWSQVTSKFTAAVKTLLAAHPGSTPVHIRVAKPAGGETLLACAVTVTDSAVLRAELAALLGAAPGRTL